MAPRSWSPRAHHRPPARCPPAPHPARPSARWRFAGQTPCGSRVRQTPPDPHFRAGPARWTVELGEPHATAVRGGVAADVAKVRHRRDVDAPAGLELGHGARRHDFLSTPGIDSGHPRPDVALEPSTGQSRNQPSELILGRNPEHHANGMNGPRGRVLADALCTLSKATDTRGARVSTLDYSDALVGRSCATGHRPRTVVLRSAVRGRLGWRTAGGAEGCW